MEELNINYSSVSKGKKITGIIIAAYLIGFSGYFCLTEIANARFDALMIASAVGAILALILLLLNTLLAGGASVVIDSSKIAVNIPESGTLNLEWVGVSEVNIGASYIVFQMNGGAKQKKLNLSKLIYTDVFAVKSKVIELCEFKNIPYKND